MITFNDYKNQIQITKAPTSVPEKKTTKFSIFRYNDPHGNTDVATGMYQACRAFKRRHILDHDTITITASGGDNVSGGDVAKNKFVFDLMQNLAGVEVSAVGNHELDATSYGFFEAIKDKNIKFVATNIKLDPDNPLNQVIKKSLIQEKNGVKYAFVGAMPIDFTACTSKAAQKGIEVEDFDDTVKSLQEEIDKLKAQGINKIFLVSHVGYETDKKLAQALDGIDVIIGGHTHTVVDGVVEEENFVKSKSNEPVLITQTGENGKYYGLVDVEFDENGILVNTNYKLTNSQMTSKSPVVEFIKEKHLGKSPVVKSIAQIDPMPQNRRTAPCAWTDWLADSMRSEMNVDIAIVNAANTRKVPQQGILTQRDVEESSPMKNKLLTTTLTQKDLVGAIRQASIETMSNKDGEPGLLHISGVEYKIDKKGNLLEMSYTDKKGKKTKIDIDNPSEKVKYSACYDNFVAKQGGEYPLLAPKFKVQEFDFDKTKTMLDYLAKQKDGLVITDDKRIEIL